MRLLLGFLLLILAGATAQAQPSGQRFVSIAFHDVDDQVDQLEADSVTSKILAQFFDWLKGTGWTAISLDDVAAAARGTRPLPEKAILITFDDGYKSLYTRVFPLLKVYRFPIVAALVGSWMEGGAGSTSVGAPEGSVLYGDRIVPRSTFITWDEAREMQASGLVEFASHSYNLHRGVPANPQGNNIPAALTWKYDPATGQYETDAQYRARIRADLEHSRRQIAANLGRMPRAVVWPFGRYSVPALEVAKSVGFTFALTLEPEPAYTSDLYAIHRYFPSRNPSVGDIARNLRFQPDDPATRRVACVSLDGLAAVAPGVPQDEALGAMIEGLRTLGANVAVIDAHVATPTPNAPIQEVYFPNRFLPMRADLLSRVSWQLRTRGGVEAFLRLPVGAAAAAVGEARVPELFADMMRQTASDGLTLDGAATPTSIVSDRPENIRARRKALDLATLDPQTRLALAAYRGATTIDPRQRLMLALPAPGGPPTWADLALLPPSADAAAIAALAGKLRAEGWFRPEVAGRVVLTLPSDPSQQVEAIRRAQRQGASAVALCPKTTLPPPPRLPAAFSAATYPYKP